MKKLKLLFNVFIISAGSAIAQNIYDPYNNSCQYPAVDIIGSNIVSAPTGGFFGEYQIFLHDHPWVTNTNLNQNAISYKIELVSFPFTTNCFSCQVSNPSLDRKLKMPDTNFPYDAIEKAWIRNTSTLPTPTLETNELKLKREFYGKYGAFIPTVAAENTHFAVLITQTITKGGDESHAPRVFYPHSVLKHTFYMHCGNQLSDPVVDSFSFVLDHTRGMMRKYPFQAANNPPSLASAHDITIFPKLISSAEVDNYILNTLNYYPKPYGVPYCLNHFLNPGDDGWDDNLYIRPSANALLQVHLANAYGASAAGYVNPTVQQPGIQHQYIIDRTIDLTLINPSEKIIYNPSEVAIDLNQSYNTTVASKTLIFPTGYTFKTIQGKYPTNTVANAADINNLYYDKTKVPFTNLSCDDVGPTNDNIFSYYRVKQGSILHIQQCVAIHDTKIIVEDGGIVIFDNRSTVSGNFQCVLDPTGAGYGVILDQNTTVTGSCAFDCYDITKYDVGNIDITANETWLNTSPYDIDNDGILRIAGTLRIASGKTLTINGGMHFEFGENGKIVVERGAKFIVNSHPSNPTTMKSTGICQKSMWQGIEVWGESTNFSQTLASTTQGYLKLTNVKISDARTAIITDNPNISPNSVDYHGGIVQCNLVEFKNNFRDAEFLSYQHKNTSGTEIANVSYFQNCQFLITETLKDPSYFVAGGRPFAGYERVKLTDVKHVRFANCTFENTAIKTDGLPLFDPDLRGAGIYGLNSSIGLKGGGSKNTFKNLSDGVWMINSDMDYITIEGNDFINNVHGLTLENTRHSGITQNHFEIPAHENRGQTATSGYNKPVGLYLISATKFTVTENTFTNYSTAVTGGELPEHYNYGMVVNKSVSELAGGVFDGYGSAYKNNFQNLNINLQTELDNRGDLSTTTIFNPQVFPGTGFAYKCNNFNSRTNYDVTVVSKDMIEGKLREQGLCNDPFNPSNNAHVQAGNNYISGCTGDEQLSFDMIAEDLDLNEGQIFKYRDQLGKLACINLNLFPSIQTCNIANGSNPCISITCSTFPCAISAYTTSSAQLSQLTSGFKQILDGGSTQSLLNSINSTMPAGQLKNLLMSKSPYLSDTVLIAMLKKANPLPPGHIQQITTANSSLTKKVLTVLNETNLPAGIKNTILSAQTGISARREKESEIDYYAFEKNMKELNLLQLYLEVDNLDSLKKIAQKDTSLLGLFKLMEVLLAQGDLSGAQTCRADIISKETPHISDRCKFLSIQLNLMLQGKTWFDMDDSQTATITQIYLNNPETAIYARAILAMVKGLRYEKYPYDISTNRRGIIFGNNEQSNIETINRLKIYPNPANDFSTVEIKLDDTITNVEFIIYNLLGSKVYSQQVKNNDVLTIDNKELNNGIYLYVLKTNNEIIEKQKVIISK